MGGLCSKDSTAKDNKSYKPNEGYGFLDALPSGVEKVTVDHVYDGDTLTICEHNKSRVRLIGVDAPELKEKEPYAKESADFVKKMCPKGSTIWLEYEDNGQNQTDRYDRLLAYVYVQNKNGAGYICVNMAVLEVGLANFYAPGNTTVSKRDIMLKASKAARSRQANIWKKVDLKKKVVHTKNGSAFHMEQCGDVNNSKVSKVTVEEALDKGLNPCRNCKPM